MHLSGLLVLLAAKGLDMQVALRPFSCGWGLLDSSNRQQEQKNLSAYVNNNSYAIYEELGDAPMLVMGALACASGQYGVCSCAFCPVGTCSSGLAIPTVSQCQACAIGMYAGTVGLTACANCTA